MAETVPASKTPVSVDYTGRDYYALRDELITRVREATNQQWQGNDPADFGLALIESFAYMGDLINYYIDRIANESYLLTATQRQSLLNIAQTYGYTPTGYVGAVVDAKITSNVGSENEVGASVLTTVNVGGVDTAHVAELAVPTNHPFAVGEYVRITDFNNDVYNGYYQIIKIGIEGAQTVICYKPQSSISTISGNGTKFTVTTTSAHQFGAGEPVVISGVTPSAYNGNWTVLEALSSTTFTVTSSLTNTYTSGGIINYQNVATDGDGTTVLGYAYEIGVTTVPAGTQLVAEVTYEDKVQQVMFTTMADATVGHIGNPDNYTVVQCRQGEDVSYRAKNLKNTATIPYDINGELIGYSDGSADQSFALLETKVDKSLLQVFVDSGTNFNQWQQVQHIADYGPNSAVYTVDIDANNIVRVNFGDGVSGAIPPQDTAIKAVYYAGGGPIGNIAIGKLNKISATPTVTDETLKSTILTQLEVTNDYVGAGGANPETNDVIRYNAPRTLSALNRAVTLDDFANLSLSLRGVGKANATAENRTSVTVYIAPTQTDSTSDPAPGVDLTTTGQPPTSAMQSLALNVLDFLADKKQIGTTVTVGYPTYVPVTLEVEYTPLPQYTIAQVESYIKSYLFDKFSYNYVDFEDVITPEEIEYKLRQVNGIRNIRVTKMHRQGGTGRSSMVGSPNEIFIFLESNLDLVTAPTNANLTSLTGVTLNQTFNSNIAEYSATVANGTASVSIVPTASDADNASITVNNVVVASGSTNVITTAVGITHVVVSVTAGDGVTVRNYKVAISRVS